jgi:hypothetical protein
MFKVFKKLVYACVIILMVMPLVSCGGSGSDTAGGTNGTGTNGTLVLGLTDDPGDYLNVYVTIKEVQVNQAAEEEEDDSGWLTVLTPGETFDLLVLQNGVIANLGLAELEAGQYNQMRLILDEEKPDAHPYANYLVIEDEEGEDPIEVELKVPSGFKTGIKIVHGFTIVASGATELILDFDANKSIVQAGKSGKWLLKPTIKVLETVTNSVSGTVDTGVDAWLEGAMVSAQIYDPGAADPKDEVTVAGATVSDILGDYFMYLPPNTYNIVASMEGYLPACLVVAATGYLDYTDNNFTLTAADPTGTVTGTVEVDGLTTADSALFSIRQTIDCGSGEVAIEVASFSVAEGATSVPIILPVGSYVVVVSAEGEVTHDEAIDVQADTTTDVIFPPAP